ncbi:MAG: TetR family transcriptional regulator [Deltaproteobacteria bacterium]|nr:TetR family transcriptional regulator [Deltaproteobacteria bacterium]
MQVVRPHGNRKTSISEVLPLFGERLRKGERTKLRIVEVATRLIAKKGLHNLTYEELARISKSSRQLIQTYYPNRDRLFEECIKLGRYQFQKFVVDALERATTPKEKLDTYLEKTLQWVDENREKVANIIFFHHLCALDPGHKALNTGHADIGSQRLTAIVVGLRPELPMGEARDLAKAIQNLIMGNLYCLVTEARDLKTVRQLAKHSIGALLRETLH